MVVVIGDSGGKKKTYQVTDTTAKRDTMCLEPLCPLLLAPLNLSCGGGDWFKFPFHKSDIYKHS
jgi:hypothetical protein